MPELKLVTTSNRKPADELAEVRERIKLLRDREAVLRDMAITGGCALVGDDFKIIVQRTKTERVNTDALKRELGLQFLRPFLSTVETVTVKTKKV